MLTKEELPECPVATTVQLIGNKWKLLILRNLIYNGAQRFTDFPKTIPGTLLQTHFFIILTLQ